MLLIMSWESSLVQKTRRSASISTSWTFSFGFRMVRITPLEMTVGRQTQSGSPFGSTRILLVGLAVPDRPAVVHWPAAADWPTAADWQTAADWPAEAASPRPWFCPAPAWAARPAGSIKER